MKLIFKVLFFVTILSVSCTKEKSKSELIESIKKDVEFLASDSLEGRETGTEGERIAADFISERMIEIGLAPMGDSGTFFQTFKKKTKANPHSKIAEGKEVIGKNVIGFLDNKKENTIIIGAHYDHLGYGVENSLHVGHKEVHNGADDNASGVAAMLALAEHFKLHPLNNNYLFIAFSGEEKGLWGSNSFVKNPTMDLSKANYMINMDMVGRLDTNRRLAIYGVGTSPVFVETINSVEEPYFNFKFDSSGVGPSDHTSFYNDSIPVLHFFTGQHEQYHKPTDDVELINFEGIYDVQLYISSLVKALEPNGKVVFTKTKDKKKEARGFKVTLGVMPDYLFDGEGMKIDGVKDDRPADKAGIIKGDVVIQMGEAKINSMMDYMKVLGNSEAGSTIEVIVKRGEEEVKVMVTFD